MKKIFLSLPFNERSRYSIMREMADMEQQYCIENDITPEMIAKREIQFVDNYHVPALTESRAQSSKIPNLVYLGWALQQMADCDDVIFSDNWETARGCQVEKLAYDLYFSLNKHTSK